MTAIPLIQRLVAIGISLILLLVTVHLIRKHKLREQYALLWLIATVAILVLSIFWRHRRPLADLFNVSYSPTLAARRRAAFRAHGTVDPERRPF